MVLSLIVVLILGLVFIAAMATVGGLYVKFEYEKDSSHVGEDDSASIRGRDSDRSTIRYEKDGDGHHPDDDDESESDNVMQLQPRDFDLSIYGEKEKEEEEDEDEDEDEDELNVDDKKVCLEGLRTFRGGEGEARMKVIDIKRIQKIMKNGDTDRVTLVDVRATTQLRTREDQRIIADLKEDKPDLTILDADLRGTNEEFRTVTFKEKVHLPHSLSVDVCAF